MSSAFDHPSWSSSALQTTSSRLTWKTSFVLSSTHLFCTACGTNPFHLKHVRAHYKFPRCSRSQWLLSSVLSFHWHNWLFLGGFEINFYVYSETKLGANNNEGKTTLWVPINYQANCKMLDSLLALITLFCLH